MSDNPWKTESSRPIYDNPWIEVVEHEVINPAGNPGIYGKVHFKNLAIAILPVDDHGYTWLVGQYRYPLGRYSWELPEGGGPHSEDPLAAAKRELQEETGLTAASWRPILEMDISNSVTDERSISYLAETITAGKANPEDTEELVVKRLPFAEVLAMALNGAITDALSIATILKASHLGSFRKYQNVFD